MRRFGLYFGAWHRQTYHGVRGFSGADRQTPPVPSWWQWLTIRLVVPSPNPWPRAWYRILWVYTRWGAWSCDITYDRRPVVEKQS